MTTRVRAAVTGLLATAMLAVLAGPTIVEYAIMAGISFNTLD
jgi:hypothetical protein